MSGKIKHGMKLADLTDEIFETIVKIYDEIVDGSGLHFLQPSAVKKVKTALESKNAFEWRFGSKLTSHSKLWIHIKNIARFSEPIIYFRFSANLDSTLQKDEKKAEKLSQHFNACIAIFLKEKDIAIEL